ncbi:MAG: superoxide dismutase family protein [Pseudohongiella sp.]|nr:superoxide dismutase family protein [Pseudohongiella sp.]MDO9520794.1 superoxide dismutase family protein [Pseudohongiella sp.]MDP2128144.1 superoxide dismutase family protein [Pseudohongiella sp.]
MMNIKPAVFALSVLSVVVACSPETEVTRTAETAQPGSAQPAADRPASAGDLPAQSVSEFIAVLQPTEGSEVSGTVIFSNTEVGVTVSANVEGLPPTSAHGFHIHEFGDCSAADASSAGDHYNPHNQQHGAPDSVRRHAGDLGNLLSNGVGVAQTSVIDSVLSFSDEDSILGRSVVIHADADDLQSQPSGDAGDRLACGVIEIDRGQS